MDGRVSRKISTNITVSTKVQRHKMILNDMLHYDDIPSPFLILQGILTSISALFPNLLNLG